MRTKQGRRHAEHEQHRVLAGASRARLLTVLLEARAPMGIAELAEAVDLHPNTTREHLEQLVGAGLVHRDPAPPRGRGRPAFRYRAARSVDDTTAYRTLAGVLAAELARRPDATTAAVAAGERWGRAAARAQRPVGDALEGADAGPADHAVDDLVALLDDAGFAPARIADTGLEIGLHRCPFGPLARERGDVLCNVHLGLMRGALRELGAPLDAVALEPFVRPDLCVAHLGTGHVR